MRWSPLPSRRLPSLPTSYTAPPGANRTLGISDKLFVAVDTPLLVGLGRVALMPMLVLAARVCPEGVEATLYAALMSLSNAGSGFGELVGAALTSRLGVTAHDFRGLPALVALCGAAHLVNLALLPLVGAHGSKAAADDEGEEEVRGQAAAAV